MQFGRKCHVNIVKTKNKGWGKVKLMSCEITSIYIDRYFFYTSGVFAGKRIPMGTFIGVYSGEIIMEEEAEKRGM